MVATLHSKRFLLVINNFENSEAPPRAPAEIALTPIQRWRR